MEKLEFKNHAGGQTVQINGVILSNGKGKWLFLSLDDKPKQGNQLKINKIQEYDANQIKKEVFQAILVNLHQCSDIGGLL